LSRPHPANPAQVREAELRQLHNQQRAQLKAFLQLSAGNSKTISTEELKLAAKLAKMTLPDDSVISKSARSSKIISSKAEDGTPREVCWQEYVKALEPVHPRTAADAAKAKAKRKADAAKRSAKLAAAGAAGADALKSSRGPVITEKELKAAHGKIRDHFATRFTEVRRGFRILDEDKSGKLKRAEMRTVLMMFNLDIEARLIEKLIDLADYDGDGEINYAEFARIMTAEDIMGLKDTLSGGIDASLAAGKVEAKGIEKHKKTYRKGGPVLRPGVTAAQLRRAQQSIRGRIENKYARLTDAFRSVDQDRTGIAERGELMRLLQTYNGEGHPPAVLETLIDFADFEGDGEIGMAEFNRVMTADDVMKMKNTLTAVADAVIVDGKGNVVEDGPVDYNAVGHRL